MISPNFLQQGNGVAHVRGAAARSAHAQFLLGNPMACVVKLQKQYGNAISVAHPISPSRPVRRLFLFGGNHNKNVFADPDDFRPNGIWPIKGPPGSAQNNMRDNILSMHGKRHVHFRKIATPHLTPARVNEQASETLAYTHDELDAWPVGQVGDVRTLARRLLQRQVFKSQFGEPDKNAGFELGDLIDRYHRYNWSWRALFRLNIPGAGYHRLLSHAELLQSKVLAWARQQQGRCPASNLRAAFTDAAGLDGCPLRDGEVAGNLAMLSMASYETCSSVLTWAMILLAQHPDITADLFDEVSGPSAGGSGDIERLLKLPLLEAVINETMRLISPVPLIGLVALQDTEVSGIPIAKSSIVILSPFMTHRLPEHYERPDEFRPERWFETKPTAYEFIPFSAGQRRCPGYWLAMKNLKIALASIVQRYRFTIVPGTRIDLTYLSTIVPGRSVPMRIVAQDRDYEASFIKGNLANFVRFPAPAA